MYSNKRLANDKRVLQAGINLRLHNCRLEELKDLSQWDE